MRAIEHAAVVLLLRHPPNHAIVLEAPEVEVSDPPVGAARHACHDRLICRGSNCLEVHSVVRARLVRPLPAALPGWVAVEVHAQRPRRRVDADVRRREVTAGHRYARHGQYGLRVDPPRAVNLIEPSRVGQVPRKSVAEVAFVATTQRRCDDYWDAPPSRSDRHALRDLLCAPRIARRDQAEAMLHRIRKIRFLRLAVIRNGLFGRCNAVLLQHV